MEIELNGAPHHLGAPYTIEQLIASLQLTGQALAVAVNRSIVAKQRWAEYRLQASDRVDVVRAIGGG